ncbi:MAG: hypothetical protein OCD76_00365 [Reichenbachiella sp.]
MKTILFLLFSFLSIQTIAQKATTHQISTGFGIAYQVGEIEYAQGLMFQLGYKHKGFLHLDRLDINPNITLGGYVNAGMHQPSQTYFISNVNLDFQYSIVQAGNFKWTIISGLGYHFIKGEISEYGDDEYTWPERHLTSHYWSGLISSGIVVYSPKKNITYDIRPISVRFGNNDFWMIYTSLIIDIPL